MTDDATTDDLSNIRTSIVLAEYTALREELMYFITQQRRKINLLSTAAIGQVSFLLLSDSVLGETFSVDTKTLLVIFLYIAPVVIFTIFAGALENTIRIILIADYIHKGIKPQLNNLANDEKLFEWEEHKASTQRLSPSLTIFMDLSKWFIFAGGILLSYCSALWLYFSDPFEPYPLLMFGGSALLNVACLVICIVSALRFNEASGETVHSGA